MPTCRSFATPYFKSKNVNVKGNGIEILTSKKRLMNFFRMNACLFHFEKKSQTQTQNQGNVNPRASHPDSVGINRQGPVNTGVHIGPRLQTLSLSPPPGPV